MIVDCFLFFQELNILEIRLEYLYDTVDKFIIVEASESFSGKKKEFLFEKNITRFEKYLDKIFYFKIKNQNKNYETLISNLDKEKGFIHKKIKDMLEKHKHYDKKILPFVLDSYHRECLHIPMSNICSDNDYIILSDLDEIPNKYFVKSIKNKNHKFPIVMKQKEFKYFLNLYSNNNWQGSIIEKYKKIKYKSLNTLRLDSSSYNSFYPGGYHFTSIGGIELLRNKLENWGHQEYNLNIIKKNLKRNILSGRDIFYRLGENRNQIIDIKDNNYIDLEMMVIISKFKDLLIIDKININLINYLKYKYEQILIYSIRFIKEPKKALIKISKKLFSFL